MKTVVALASFILLTVLGAVGAWYWMFGPSRGSATDISPVSIGVLRLNVPQAYARGGSLVRIGAVERIDTVARFPRMEAAGIPPNTTTDMTKLEPHTLVFIAVIRGDGGLDPADRPQEIYGRFLEPDTWANPGGLVLRRFVPGSPYADEELYIAPPDGRSFSARCRRAEVAAGSLEAVTTALGETCLWRYRLNEQDVQVRFSPALLPQWEELAQGVRALVNSWRIAD